MRSRNCWWPARRSTVRWRNRARDVASVRQFRTQESLEAERQTRAEVVPFLKRNGFANISEERIKRGTSISQTITASTGDGIPLKMHVRLCWRRDGRNRRENDYSAAQLRTRLVNEDWGQTLEYIESRELRDRNSHNLFIQDSPTGFVHAALVPSNQLAPIWHRQREVSAALIEQGKTGAFRKNHAANGASPTLWLQDDRTPHTNAVAEVLWTWPGVVNILADRGGGGDSDGQIDDSFDDIGLPDQALGRDEGIRTVTQRSGFRRDSRVRLKVLKRAQGKCERAGCSAARAFSGFLDVHHILGVWSSDRVWSCVALCPNCHREAHFGPERDRMNADLRAYAAEQRESQSDERDFS